MTELSCSPYSALRVPCISAAFFFFIALAYNRTGAPVHESYERFSLTEKHVKLVTTKPSPSFGKERVAVIEGAE